MATDADTITADAPADAALPSLTDAYKEEGAPAEPEQEPDEGAEAGEGEPGDVDGDEQDAGDEPDAVEEEAAEPIAAPVSWAKDAKEIFATLPREAQEAIAKRETERERFIQQKGQEAAATRRTVETEARNALTTIMQNHSRQIEAFMPQMPEMPNPQLLNTGDPAHRDLYYQQRAQYDYAAAQREQITQQLEQVRQHAEAVSGQQYEAEIEAEHEVLERELQTEWSDPSERAKLLERLQPIAAELGYSQEVMAQARAADILALRQIGNWRDDAEKYRSLMKKKMEPVRAAKKPLPPVARPGAPTGQSKPVGSLAALYPDDLPRN